MLSGPSGSGKDAVVDEWRLLEPRVTEVTTYTTRAMRVGETDGVDYYFVTSEQFGALASEGDLLEWKEVHGKLYGSPARQTDDLVEDGRIAVLKIDVQGARDLRLKRPEAVSIFVMPPSLEALEERLRKRATETEEQIQTRLVSARLEIACANEYEFVVVNDDLKQCALEVHQIVSGRLKCLR